MSFLKFTNHGQLGLGIAQAVVVTEPVAVVVLESVLETEIVLDGPEIVLVAEIAQTVHPLHHLDEPQLLTLVPATRAPVVGIQAAGRVCQPLFLCCVNVDGKEDFP